MRLSSNSPCIDAGDETPLPADAFDLDGDTVTAEPLSRDLSNLPRVFDDPLSDVPGS